MDCASTVAVVVPSPATSEVLEATSRTICAPMFSRGSLSSLSFATHNPHYARLLLRMNQLLGAFQDAEDFFFPHDDEVFTVNLDFRAGILAEQDAVARLHVQGESLALVVGFATPAGDPFAFLRLVLGAVGDDDATPGGFGLFYTTYNNAVMQGRQLGSHSSYSFQAVGSLWIAIHDSQRGRGFGVGTSLLIKLRGSPITRREHRRTTETGCSHPSPT